MTDISTGTNADYPTLVAIKVSGSHPLVDGFAGAHHLQTGQGDVFDVSGKETYAPGKGYHGQSMIYC